MDRHFLAVVIGAPANYDGEEEIPEAGVLHDVFPAALPTVNFEDIIEPEASHERSTTKTKNGIECSPIKCNEENIMPMPIEGGVDAIHCAIPETIHCYCVMGIEGEGESELAIPLSCGLLAYPHNVPLFNGDGINDAPCAKI